MSRLFITGMFRSGTTLLARMLHTHENITCASDPFRPFFNAFRDTVAVETDTVVGEFDPLGDYFADEAALRLFDAIQESTLDRSFPNEKRERLQDRIISHAEPFSPKITDRLDGIRGETFRAVYDDLWSYIPESYGTGTERWTGAKEVWTTEFTPVLADAYPDSKFVLVVRDPRAVCASKNVQEESKYPWLFLIRQWRKLAILSYQYTEQFQDRVHLVRYEDLVRSPRETATELYDFLDIGLDETTLDPSNFVDGSGDQWLQNTSHDENEAAEFNTNSVDKWKHTLDTEVVEFIEQLCYPEMAVHGYQFAAVDSPELAEKTLLDPPRVPRSELADWISDYWDQTPTEDRNEVATEHLRQRLFTCDQSLIERLGDDVRPYVLSEQYLSTARRTVDQKRGENT